MNPLPLKIYYTLPEAATFLNEHFKRSDIDESYFFQLGMKGVIKIGVFTDPTFKKQERELGTIYSDWFEFEDQTKLIDYVEAVSSSAVSIIEPGSILIVNSSSIKDIFFHEKMPLNDVFLDNIYSIDTQEFCIKDDLQQDFSCFKYADKLLVHSYLQIAWYSKKKNEVRCIFNDKREFLEFPEREEGEDWRLGHWFNNDFDANNVNDVDLYSNRIISKEDCLVLGDDLELLLMGKQREPVTIHPRKRGDRTNLPEIEIKLHPKRENSIHKIVLALATKADLDLTNHHTAHEKLKSFCESRGIDLPNKDTCGNLFKAANQFKNSN